MRVIRCVGLAAIAFAALASTSPANAPAVTLCEVNAVEECPEGQQYPAGQELKGVLQSEVAAFESPAFSFSCNEASLAGEVELVLWTQLPGEMDEFNLGDCASGLCDVEALQLPWKFEVQSSAAGHGTLKIFNGGSGKPGVSIVCAAPLSLECTYKAFTVQLDLEGGEPGKLRAVAEPLEKQGSPNSAGCPPDLFFTATYNILGPDPVWVAQNDS